MNHNHRRHCLAHYRYWVHIKSKNMPNSYLDGAFQDRKCALLYAQQMKLQHSSRTITVTDCSTGEVLDYE
jgi:hypothetical protein